MSKSRRIALHDPVFPADDLGSGLALEEKEIPQVQGSLGEGQIRGQELIPANRRKTFKHNKPTILEE